MDMKEVLKAAIKDALQIALEQGELPEGAYPEAHLEVPPQKEFGDFSTNCYAICTDSEIESKSYCGNDHFPYEL